MPKLTVKQIEALNVPGRYNDGNNLYLEISAGGSKSWVYRYRFAGKRRDMGLGGADKISLADARRRAVDAQKLINDGMDPLAERRAQEHAGETFGAYADAWLATNSKKFKSKHTIRQWGKTVREYCAGLRPLTFPEIDTDKVLKIVRPLWLRVPETGYKVRGRIEVIIDAWKVERGYHGENPARWRGHLKAVLPTRAKLTRGHHPALPYADLPGFVVELRSRQDSVGALALEFCILTAKRTTEVREAAWSEIDEEKAIWTIPQARMKQHPSGHRVPLSARTLVILKQLKEWKDPKSDFVFPGPEAGKPLSSGGMAAVLKRMKREDITVHGFRSTFSDWVAEQTDFPSEVREMALAHVIENEAEAAYRRGDLFQKRVALMAAWEKHALQLAPASHPRAIRPVHPAQAPSPSTG